VGAQEQLLRERRERLALGRLLKGDSQDLVAKVEKLQDRSKELERELEEMRMKLASAEAGALLARLRTSPTGVKVIAEALEGVDAEMLRVMVDRLRLKLGSGLVALGSTHAGQGLIVAGLTSDLSKALHVGNIVKEAVKLSGGRGGGRPDFAQAGGVEAALLGKTLDRVFELVS
jgi:alanyl-tRNA synthetase